ncbi:hypothetical protein [Phytohabitans suffuscus]|uniref:hypothetical protein n=1 Tax=Phytohabitans suffuscus TaxID=624315 RepID=UPI0015653930|nr:hypothetical protein [Phytohabitans suffuscus]
MTAAEYAAGVLEQHGSLGAEVAAVLAYCMAAPVAQEMAAAITGSGHTPVPMILFDGEPATAAAVEAGYQVAATQLSARVGASESAARRTLVLDPALLADRPDDAVHRMRQTLVEMGMTALSADDAEAAADIADQLADFYLDWLVQLVAAHNTSWPAWGGDVLHIASRDHRFTGGWPGAGSTRVWRVDAPRAALLARPETKRLACAFLAGAAHTG